MDGHPQIIFMQGYFKKISISLLVIFVLFIFFSLGTNYFEKQLASLVSVITAWVTINPLEVDVSAPAEVEVDKIFKVEARIINKGEEKIENSEGEILFPEGLVLLGKASVKKIGLIPGKREKKISWSMRAEKEGNYIISILASGELKGQLVQAEDSATVTAKLSLQRKNLWQRLWEFLKI